MKEMVLEVLIRTKQGMGTCSRIRASGSSMRPTLKEGDWLTVRHLGPSELREGDLGVFRTEKVLLVHRVIDVQPHDEKIFFLLKGDACLESELLSGDHLLGKVVEVHQDGVKVCLEGTAWRRLNTVMGRFLGWGHARSEDLRRVERWFLGTKRLKSRFLPSRIIFSAYCLAQRNLIGLAYLLRLGRLGRKHESKILLKYIKAGLQGATPLDFNQSSRDEVDWEYFTGKAIRQGVAPLLYGTIGQAAAGCGVPEAALRRLERSYYATAAYNLRLFRRLKAALESFQDAGVGVLVLKGPVLASLTYPNFAVRPIGDLDLLIRPEDYERACGLLKGLGYCLDPSVPQLGSDEMVDYAHCFSQVRFWSHDGTVIETHFSLLNIGPPKEDTAVIWRRSLGFEGVGFQGRMPSPEDMLIHLCLHAIQHNYSKLLYFCDIASLLTRYGDRLDWGYLTAAVARRRMRPLVYNTLLLTRELLGVSAPEAALSALKPGLLRQRLFDMVWDIDRALALEKRKRSPALEAVVLSLAEMDDPWSKLLYIVRVCFPRRKWLSAHFSKRMTVLDYVWDLPRYLLENVLNARSAGKLK